MSTFCRLPSNDRGGIRLLRESPVPWWVERLLSLLATPTGAPDQPNREWQACVATSLSGPPGKECQPGCCPKWHRSDQRPKLRALQSAGMQPWQIRAPQKRKLVIPSLARQPPVQTSRSRRFVLAPVQAKDKQPPCN